MTDTTPTPRTARLAAALAAAVGGAALLWAFWTTLAAAAHRWAHDPQYSHGYLVPIFALFLLWLRRAKLDPAALAPSWWGLPLLAAGVVAQSGGAFYSSDGLEAVAFLPCVFGLCLTAGGWAAMRWAWPALAYLAFMIPLPYGVSVLMAGPLQRLATIASCFLMQTLGMPAIAEGNVIRLNDAEIGIVEACSGLRMLVVFFALATAVVLVVRRPWWEKAAIFLSAIPIALVSNLLRVTATGVLHELATSEVANAFFHDAAGWLMMPLALALLWTELQILKRLLLDAAPVGPTRLGHATAPRRPASGVA